METLLQVLRNPAEMNSQQWLLVVIILLVLAGGAWFVHRLYRIIETERKSSYVPNIGRKRLNMDATRPDNQAPENKESTAASNIEKGKVE